MNASSQDPVHLQSGGSGCQSWTQSHHWPPPVAAVGGGVALYRDGTYLGSVRVQNNNQQYAYKLNMVTCVPGNYHAMGYAYANFNGGAADVFRNVTTPTVAVTCT